MFGKAILSLPEICKQSKLYIIRYSVVWIKYEFLLTTSASTFPCSQITWLVTTGFHLYIPYINKEFFCRHFYVVALKLKEGKEFSSPDSYKNNDLVKYEARKSSNPRPYIAAVVTSKNENIFTLGDGRNTSDPTSRRRRSTSSDYYNGPLESGTSYSIFQRIFISGEVFRLSLFV